MTGNINLIKKYFPRLTDLQVRQFGDLQQLYSDWNEKINVISRRDIGYLYERHVLHSLSVAKIVRFRPGSDILDIGTGGGFPGIPLAILFPQTKFTLADSVKKKIGVVKSITQSLQLKNVVPLAVRAENVPGYYDFVTCRAVARLSILFNWAQKKIKKRSRHSIANGMLCLKGGDIKNEADELNVPCRIYDLSDFFQEPFFETKKLVHVRM